MTWSWASLLIDASRINEFHRVSYGEDLRWLFQLRLYEWLESLGEPVIRGPISLSRLRIKDALLLDGDHLSYQTSLSRLENISAKFCAGYGFDSYSLSSINYRHHLRDFAWPSGYVSEGPWSLGNFAVILSRPAVGHVRPLPFDATACGMAEFPLGKHRSVWVWLGVWLRRSQVGADLLARLEPIPPSPNGWRGYITDNRHHKGLFMQHYAHLGDDECELREQLGFPPKGASGLSEAILCRSICGIFGSGSIVRRYRGKELDGLEIDIWIPEKKIGFEYQGEQHFKQIEHWQGPDGLANQRTRDARKKVLCTSLGYRLMCIKHGADLSRQGVLFALRDAGWCDEDDIYEFRHYPEIPPFGIKQDTEKQQ